jgi:hypothetical protein
MVEARDHGEKWRKAHSASSKYSEVNLNGSSSFRKRRFKGRWNRSLKKSRSQVRMI